jgi:hypothetical protein
MRVTLVSPVGVEVDVPAGSVADALIAAGYSTKEQRPKKTAARKSQTARKKQTTE